MDCARNFRNTTMTTWSQAQYRLVKEHLGVGHLRLVMGTSMGGMLVWVWGEKYPDFMDALLPTAAQPTAVAGRNWMMRRMVVDLIRNDPEWNGGNYTTAAAQPEAGAGIFRRRHQRRHAGDLPGRAHAGESRSDPGPAAGAASNADANDVIYQMEASRDYDPAPQLETIQARVLAINSADDERNPAELGIMEREIKRVKQGRYVLIPTGPETRGHGTMGLAKLWKQYLAEFMQPPVQASK